MIRTGGYTGTLYNWNTVGGEGAGYCSYATTTSCNTTFTQRLVWEWSGLSTITALVGSDIVSAGFTVYGTHSYNCTATTTDLHMLAGISPSTTWGSLEWASYNLVSSRTEYHSVACGNTGWRTFDAKWAIQQFADNDSWTTLSLGLKARDESTMTSWKRFGHDATLSVEYNRAPNTPSSLQLTDPNIPSCVTGSSRPFINTTTPTLSAVVSDPDGGTVDAHFQVATTGNAADVRWNSGWLSKQASGTRFNSKVGSGLSNGGTYSWHVMAGDGVRPSTYSGWCEFTVDTTLPVTPTVTPVTSGTGVDAVYAENVERGGVGMKGKFTLSPGSSTDVVKFSYSFGDPAAMTPVTVTQGGSYTVSYDPTTSGPKTLYVKSTDRAGNVSPQRAYAFKVAAPVEDVIWKLDENTGSSAANSGPKTAGPLSITGAGWVAGPHQLFGSRGNDWALSFDGVNDAAISGGPILDTSKSFTVSAHVLLNNSKLGQGNYTVLSQDGLTQSAFQLGYRSNCDANGTDCWSFSMPDTSSGTTVTAATSSSVTADQWVHLVGEHDVTAKTMRLWVCEVGTPEQIATGEPVESTRVTRGGVVWKSPGVFAVGRGQAAAAGAGWWPGQIDNVRLFSGQITDPSKLRRLCQGAEVEDFGQGVTAFNAVDPTVSEQ